MTTFITHQVARSPTARWERLRHHHTRRQHDVAHHRVTRHRGEWLLLTTLTIGACSTASSPTDPNAAPSPVSLNVVAGNTQHAPVNTTLPQALRVQVLDNSGHPVPNFLLNFVVTSGGGHVFGGAEETNSSGYAQEQWTLGPRLGPQTLDVRQVNSWSGVAASYGSFTATGTPPNTVVVVTTSGPTGLAIMNADGSGLHAINVGTLKAANPTLSPDHTHVLFDTQKGGYEVSIDGSGLKQILQQTGTTDTTVSEVFFNPAWSPDGVNYLWNFNIYGLGVGLVATNFNPVLQGGGILTDPTNCTGEASQGGYSADGTKFLYVTFQGFLATNCPPGQTGIVTSDVNPPSSVPLITYDPQNYHQAMILPGGTWPSWSPDGQHIAASYNGQTVVMDPDGNNRKVILPKSYGAVSWSPDSQLWAVDSGFVNADGTNYVAVKGCPCKFAWR